MGNIFYCHSIFGVNIFLLNAFECDIILFYFYMTVSCVVAFVIHFIIIVRCILYNMSAYTFISFNSEENFGMRNAR